MRQEGWSQPRPCLPAPCCSGGRGAPLGLLSRGTSVAARGEQESDSHSFCSTSKIPEDKLPWQCCPQPPPWHGVPVRRLTTRLLPASPHGLHPGTSCPHHLSGPVRHFELLPSCIPLLLGTLAVGSTPGTAGHSFCGECPAAPCPNVPPLLRDMDYISAKKDVFLSEMVTLEGGGDCSRVWK